MLSPSMLGAVSEYFYWWQIPLVLILIALIAFLVWYRRRQT